MKKKILIICLAAGILILTACCVTGVLFIKADAQKEEEEKGHQSWSPEIFFHVDGEITTDVTVHIEDGITVTIPDIEDGESVTWKEVSVDETGMITYGAREFPYLYYEGHFVHRYGPSILCAAQWISHLNFVFNYNRTKS